LVITNERKEIEGRQMACVCTQLGYIDVWKLLVGCIVKFL
jgi:hypothetical protein